MTLYKHMNFMPFVQRCTLLTVILGYKPLQSPAFCVFFVSCSPVPELAAQMNSVTQIWLFLWDSRHLLNIVSKQEKDSGPFRRKNVHFHKLRPSQFSTLYQDYPDLIQNMDFNHYIENVEKVAVIKYFISTFGVRRLHQGCQKQSSGFAFFFS